MAKDTEIHADVGGMADRLGQQLKAVDVARTLQDDQSEF
jgi:hypothetical protein